ncbi:helix-turn-helix transcriptional regulator [Kineococcus arenarius]|uniref:helix-turn-helix transcriptional regulator n=1 Tax=Kineococcus sp. SYSU DK007 TaxID=3383128 RepID=UPI003D7D0886
MPRTLTAYPDVRTENPPPLWTVDDVAAYLGVPTGTLYQWSSRGIGPRTRKVGRHLRYRPQDVEAWLDGRERGGAA